MHRSSMVLIDNKLREYTTSRLVSQELEILWCKEQGSISNLHVLCVAYHVLGGAERAYKFV